VEAAHDEPVSVRVEQRQGEALIAAGFLEGIEANEADPSQRLPAVSLEDRGSSGQLVQLGSDRVDLVDVSVEDRFEAPSAFATGQPIEPTAQATEPTCLDDDDEEQEHDEHAQCADEGSDIRLDERVEIDGSCSSGGIGRSLAAVDHRGLTRSTMLSSPVATPI
jgi:hypothetical protein